MMQPASFSLADSSLIQAWQLTCLYNSSLVAGQCQSLKVAEAIPIPNWFAPSEMLIESYDRWGFVQFLAASIKITLIPY